MTRKRCLNEATYWIMSESHVRFGAAPHRLGLGALTESGSSSRTLNPRLTNSLFSMCNKYTYVFIRFPKVASLSALTMLGNLCLPLHMQPAGRPSPRARSRDRESRRVTIHVASDATRHDPRARCRSVRSCKYFKIPVQYKQTALQEVVSNQEHASKYVDISTVSRLCPERADATHTM